MKWIKITDKLPENEEECLFFCQGHIYSGYLYSGFEGNDDGINDYCIDVVMHSCENCEIEEAEYIEDRISFRDITHWMPFPKPPKKDELEIVE